MLSIFFQVSLQADSECFLQRDRESIEQEIAALKELKDYYHKKAIRFRDMAHRHSFQEYVYPEPFVAWDKVFDFESRIKKIQEKISVLEWEKQDPAL